GQYRYVGLHDGRPAVQFLGNEVYGGAVFAVTGFQGALVGMQSGVLGQQGGVDVQQAAQVVVDEPGGEDAHEAGEYHQLRLVAVDQRRQRLIVAGAVRVVPVAEHGMGDAGSGGAFQSIGIGAVGNDRDDVSLLGVQGIDECL